MYAFIEGTVAEKGVNELVIEAGGVGYLLSCSMNTLSAAPPAGERMRVYTWLSVREDAMELFGFSSREEKRMFQRLVGVSGIGPRTALGVLGAMPLRDLTLAIVTGDTAALSRAPGIGKKTAQRITLELKEAFTESDFSALPEAAQALHEALPGDGVNEAVAALQTLGYTPAEAARAVSQVRGQSDKSDELIRLALRAMSAL